MELLISEITNLLEGRMEGPDARISRITSLHDADGSSISFFSNSKYESSLYASKAACVIVPSDFKPKEKIKATLIHVHNPYLSFSHLLEEFHRLDDMEKRGMEEPCYLGKNVDMGEGCYIGAFAYLGDQVKLGNHVKIYPQVYIGDQVTIGDHTIIYPGVKVYSQSIIGNYCTLEAGAIIGSAGFGFAPQPDGSYKEILQVGKVVLEDHVSIGANTTIDRGTLESTIIHSGTKIDNLVQVAHNVEIGENTVIAAQSGISGSAKIGNQVTFGGQVGVQGHILVANNTTVGAKSGVTKTVRKEGQTISGKFAFAHQDYLKSYAVFRKLPGLMRRIELLEQKILNLSARESI